MVPSLIAVIAPSAKSRLPGSVPEADRQCTRASRPSTGIAERGNATKVQSGDLAPGERDRFSLDRHHDPFAIGLLTVPKIWSPTTRRASSCLMSSSKLADGSAKRVNCRSSMWQTGDSGRVGHRRVGRGGQAGNPQRDERALGALAVRQVLPVDGDLGLIGCRSEATSDATPACVPAAAPTSRDRPTFRPPDSRPPSRE